MGKTNSKSPLQDELDKFRRAIAMGDLQTLIQILENKPHFVNKSLTENSISPVIYASMFHQIQVLQFLLMEQADIDNVDNQGCSALHYMVMQRSPQGIAIIDLLCKTGANPFLKSDSGVTAKELALGTNWVRAAKLLEFHEKEGTWVKMPMHARIRLLWISEGSVYGQLSQQVLREICNWIQVYFKLEFLGR